MGRNKELRKQIASHQRRILEHHAKIKSEESSDLPRAEVIQHWKKEIRDWKESIRQMQRRLKRDW